MGYVVFVGTRQPGRTPLNALNLFQNAAATLAAKGYGIRAGGEVGSDRLATDAALAAGGRVELYLPFAGFAEEWIGYVAAKYQDRFTTVVFDPQRHAEWVECVRTIHPNGKFLSRASTANLARSCGMVLGASAVVALPYVRKEDRGVSGMILRLAVSRDVPAYDLSRSADYVALRGLLETETA